MDENQPLWKREIDELLQKMSTAPEEGDQIRTLKLTQEAFTAMQLVHNRFNCTDIGEALGYICQTAGFFLQYCKRPRDRAVILSNPANFKESLRGGLLIASQPASFFLNLTALPPSEDIVIRQLVIGQKTLRKLKILAKPLALDVTTDDGLNMFINHACKIGAWALTHITENVSANILLAIPLFVRESRPGEWFLQLHQA